MGVPEEKEKTATRFEEIVAKIPQIWGKVGIYKFKKFSELPSMLNPKEPTNHTETHYNQTVTSKSILKAAREKWFII